MQIKLMRLLLGLLLKERAILLTPIVSCQNWLSLLESLKWFKGHATRSFLFLCLYCKNEKVNEVNMTQICNIQLPVLPDPQSQSGNFINVFTEAPMFNR